MRKRRRDRLYNIWSGMKHRCYNPNSTIYRNYGGRGVSVCPEWRNNFSAFRDWSMSNGYAKNKSIDRIDVNGDYCPENCRWASQSQQQRNKRNSQTAFYKGCEMSLADIAEKTGINLRTLRSRIQILGWSVEKAVSTPVRSLNKPKK